MWLARSILFLHGMAAWDAKCEELIGVRDEQKESQVITS
jgi:hypothetical protein